MNLVRQANWTGRELLHGQQMAYTKEGHPCNEPDFSLGEYGVVNRNCGMTRLRDSWILIKD